MKILKGQEKDWCDGHLDVKGRRIWIPFKQVNRIRGIADEGVYRRPKNIRCPKCNRLLTPETYDIETWWGSPPSGAKGNTAYRIPIHKVPITKRDKTRRRNENKRNSYRRS